MPNYSTKKSSSLLFPAIALCLLLLVEHASGNISIPQQDIQPVFDPELVPELRLDETMVPSSVPTSAPSMMPTTQPSFEEPSTKEAPFRQEFTVGSGLGYISDDILLLGALYQRYTSEYLSPIPETEIVSKIDVICDVKELDIHLLADGETLIVDYKMKYVSQHYDVSLYPLLFQNWTNSNLDTVLEQMQSLGLNVTAVGTVKRILIATREPTVAPSMAPTAIPIPTMEGYSDITDTIIDAPGSRIDLPEEPLDFSISVHPAPESSWTNEPWSNFGVIIIVISSIMGICILTVGLNIYIERKKNPPGHNFDTNIGKRAIWNDPRRRETSITDVEAFHPDGSPSARNNGESIIIDY